MEQSINIKNLSLNYKGQKEIVNIPSMIIPGGISIGFFGPNRVGKSTLLKVLVNATNKIEYSKRSIDYLGFPTNHISVYQPQDYNSSLLPWYSIKKNIRLPFEALKVMTSDLNERINQFFKELGYKDEDNFLKDYGFLRLNNNNKEIPKAINELSGGQKQILSIIKSLVLSPHLLALDEPFSAIDIFNKGSKFRTDIINYLRMKRITTLIVSHDLDEIIDATDRLFIFNYDENNEIYKGHENSKLEKENYNSFVDNLNSNYGLNLEL